MSPHHGDRPHEQGERQQTGRGQSGQPGQSGGQSGPRQGQRPGQQPRTGQGGQPTQGQPTQGQPTRGQPTQGGQGAPRGGQGPPSGGGGFQQGPGTHQQSGMGSQRGGQTPPMGKPQSRPPSGGGGQPGAGTHQSTHQSGMGTHQSGRGTQQQGPPQQSTQPPAQLGGPQSQFGGPGSQGIGTQPGGQRMGPGMGGGQPGLGRRRPGPQLNPVTVEEIVQGDPVTVEPDTPVTTVVSQMAEEDVGSVIVVEDDQPQGIITDRKVAMAIEQYETVSELTAEDLVTGDVTTTTTDESVFDILRTMRDGGVRRLPVVDDEGTLAGVVALDDVIVLLATEIGNVGETIQNQIERLG